MAIQDDSLVRPRLGFSRPFRLRPRLGVPQGSKWIEELFGRKISLHATAMVGVSSSGFTEGAIKKAKRLGVFLCNLSELTDNEIKSWGKKTKSNGIITFFKI